jgi:hypothetical protein
MQFSSSSPDIAPERSNSPPAPIPPDPNEIQLLKINIHGLYKPSSPGFLFIIPLLITPDIRL